MEKCFYEMLGGVNPWDNAYLNGKAARGYGETLSPVEMVVYLHHRRQMLANARDAATTRGSRRMSDLAAGGHRAMCEVIACMDTRTDEGRGAWPDAWGVGTHPDTQGATEYMRAYTDMKIAAWVMVCECGCQRATATVLGRGGHRLAWEMFAPGEGPALTRRQQVLSVTKICDDILGDLCLGDDPHEGSGLDLR